MSVSLILVRHTQTNHNREGRYSGAREDVVLNSTGITQAKKLAKTIAARGLIRAIFSSDLRRTRQVATIIAKACGLGRELVTFDKRLREVDIGKAGGLLKADVYAQFPEPHFRTSDPNYDFSSIGGERRWQVVERQLACFREIDEKFGRPDGRESDTIVVVGHGTALRTIIEELGIDPPVLHEQGKYQTITFGE